MKTKFLNLGIILCLVLVTLFIARPVQAEDPPPVWPPSPEGFWNYPYDPSVYDHISFGTYAVLDPSWTCEWDFGDGSTSHDCWVNATKQYRADGDYSVAVLVSNELGDTAWFGRTVSVRTHEVAITRFSVPRTASVGQTRQVTVFVRNSRYPENVQVELLKSTVDGYVEIGMQQQLVPVRVSNRTTAFKFSYTFTAEDALNGKVTFKALAFLLDAREAWPVDNELISLPVRVVR